MRGERNFKGYEALKQEKTGCLFVGERLQTICPCPAFDGENIVRDKKNSIVDDQLSIHVNRMTININTNLREILVNQNE